MLHFLHDCVLSSLVCCCSVVVVVVEEMVVVFEPALGGMNETIYNDNDKEE